MTQPDLRKLAQQGNPGAIALWLNQILQPRGVTAKVVLRDQRLKVLLASSRPLEQQAFIRFVQQQISQLAVEGITSVKVYGQQVGEDVPAWIEEFPIALRADSAAIISFNPSSPKVSPSAIVPYQTEDFFAALRSFQMSFIFPYRDVFSRELYRHPLVQLLLFLGLFPLVINLIAEQVSLAQTAWLTGIYYAAMWGVLLYNLIKPPQFSWGNTLKCVVFTAFISIPILLLIQRVPPFSTLYQATGQGLVGRLIGFVFGVGVLEEVCKALPVYLLLLRRGKLTEPHTAAFYGAMSGLGFAIAEGAAYSLLYALGLTRGQLGLGSYVAANTIRFVSLPLFHAILAGIVGYFMGLGAINPARQTALLVIGLTIAATLHGLYNTFAGAVPGLFVVAFAIALFFTYLRRSKEMVEHMHQAERKFRSKN
ncbi:MAG TPA: PrsW family glutamic-type intramembrane protease [Trichocoleus sp.]|jgi:RsiW-degrading membrane proteinase PrsW (M82 family)